MADKNIFKAEVDFDGTTNVKGALNSSGTATHSGANTFSSTVDLDGTTKCSGASSKLNYISDPITAPASTTTTLTRAQSGGVVLITPNAALVVLPAVATAGQRFEFVMGGDYSTANCTVTTADGDFVGGISTGAGGKAMAPSPANTATFGSDADAGDRFECVSNGTNWYIVNGFCEAAAGIAFTEE